VFRINEYILWGYHAIPHIIDISSKVLPRPYVVCRSLSSAIYKFISNGALKVQVQNNLIIKITASAIDVNDIADISVTIATIISTFAISRPEHFCNV